MESLWVTTKREIVCWTFLEETVDFKQTLITVCYCDRETCSSQWERQRKGGIEGAGWNSNQINDESAPPHDLLREVANWKERDLFTSNSDMREWHQGIGVWYVLSLMPNKYWIPNERHNIFCIALSILFLICVFCKQKAETERMLDLSTLWVVSKGNKTDDIIIW